MGYSTGRWDADTSSSRRRVNKLWLDQLGRPTTDRLRVIERFTRTQFGHMRIDVAIDDPGAYTAPWSRRRSCTCGRVEPLEFICEENNRDIERGDGSAAGLSTSRRRGGGYLE
jgi:hypothetical protein